MAEVRFSRKALSDLRAIQRYLAERSPAAASRVIAAIEHSAALLADHPKLGRAEDRGFGRIHIVPRYGYAISYRMDGGIVEIRFIFHPRQSR